MSIEQTIENTEPSINIEVININNLLESLVEEIENDYYCLLED